ncbi:MAG TPA: hypothetical protein VGM27_13725 [Acidobacteriaceae bacterium]
MNQDRSGIWEDLQERLPSSPVTIAVWYSKGAYVYITGRRQDELDNAVATLGSGITGVQGDISNLDDLV